MTRSTILSGMQVHNILHTAAAKKETANMTFMSKGKWHSQKITFLSVTEQTLQIRLPEYKGDIPMDIVIDQPVGISLNSGIDVYIFEVTVVGFEASVNKGKGGVIVLNAPENLEKMQRRTFTRVDVPNSLNVKVLFWHRGYMGSNFEAPMDNYWQGELVDLSAGGAQISIPKYLCNNFKISQIVGLQFTPLPYEKPIIIEGQVRRINPSENDDIMVGIEFLGIESETDGRDKLYRIIDTINEYEHINADHESKQTTANKSD